MPLTRCLLRLASLALAAQGLPAAAQDAPAAPRIEAPAVEVIASQPLPGLMVPREHLPANAQSATAEDLRAVQALNLPDFMAARLPSVNVNEIQGNPYQADLNYRGFTASPLLGTPQGLSVFLDGVRLNEPFGDGVSWDLIPHSAIATADLLPGANPAFGLNTLGGALSLHSKSGDTHPGFAAQAEGGSFGRRIADVEYGGSRDGLAWYGNAHGFREDGWRDASPGTVRQIFARLGRRSGATDIDLSLAAANNDLTGNGLVPLGMFEQRRAQVFTHPDNTRNRSTLLTLSAGHWLSDELRLTGLLYHRALRRGTLNGDVNDDFEEDPALDGAAGANGGSGVNQDTAANNRTHLRTRASGGALQLTVSRAGHRVALGASFDASRSRFEQSSQLGVFDAGRGVLATGGETLENSLDGRTDAAGLYLSDTIGLGAATHLTVSGRWNRSRVVTRDRLNPVPPNLDGDFTYTKFNPALGLTHDVAPGWQVYGNLGQGSRAPSPIELGCADPANPCTLPNALASDPFLKQVVSRTIEAGLRGKGGRWHWHAGAFRARNHDDILFVSTATSAGYFTNFGRTQRQGVELGAGGETSRWRWQMHYSLVDATFRSPAMLLSPNNSTRGTEPGLADDEILVRPGDRIPGIPRHSLKLVVEARLDAAWSIGATLNAYSKQYARGNENNRHQAGTFTDAFGNTRSFAGSGVVPGYAVLNLNARWRVAKDWEFFARLDNVFDRRYFTAGALAENPFDAAGSFRTNSDDWTRETFYAPGAPRALWLGARWTLAER